MDKNKMMIGGGALAVVVIALFFLLGGNSINNKLDEVLETFTSMTEVVKSIKSNEDFKNKAEDYQVLADELSTLLDELNEFTKPDSEEEIAELVEEYYPLFVKVGDSDTEAWMDLRSVVDRPEEDHPFMKVLEDLESAFEKMEDNWFFKAMDEHETAVYEAEKAERLKNIDKCDCMEPAYFDNNWSDCEEKLGFDIYSAMDCLEYAGDTDEDEWCSEILVELEEVLINCGF